MVFIILAVLCNKLLLCYLSLAFFFCVFVCVRRQKPSVGIRSGMSVTTPLIPLFIGDFSLYPLFSTLSSLPSLLYPLLYPLFSTLSSLPSSLPSLLYPLFSTLSSLPSLLYPLFSTLSSLPSLLYPLFSTLSSPPSLLYPLFSTLSSLPSLLYPLFTGSLLRNTNGECIKIGYKISFLWNKMGYEWHKDKFTLTTFYYLFFFPFLM